MDKKSKKIYNNYNSMERRAPRVWAVFTSQCRDWLLEKEQPLERKEAEPPQVRVEASGRFGGATVLPNLAFAGT